jgi:hypothetical protein
MHVCVFIVFSLRRELPDLILEGKPLISDVVLSSFHETTHFGRLEFIVDRFGSLEFIADHFGSLSLSPEGNDSGAIFVGMVHSGSLSLHTILMESIDEDDTTSSGGGSFGFPISQGCNIVTPTIPITTTPQPEGTLVSLTIPTTPLWTAAPQSYTGLLREPQ